MLRGSGRENTPDSKSNALLVFVMRADQRFRTGMISQPLPEGLRNRDVDSCTQVQSVFPHHDNRYYSTFHPPAARNYTPGEHISFLP
jgi:hypothetical protein